MSTRGVFSKGPAYVPLEVSTQAEEDLEDDHVNYRYRPFSQRMARRRSRPARNWWSLLVGGVAMAFVIAAVALWAWALVLLLVRLNALRSPHEQPQMLDLQQENNAPLPAAPAVTEVLALPAPESD
eukprot:s1213_g11.t1